MGSNAKSYGEESESDEKEDVTPTPLRTSLTSPKEKKQMKMKKMLRQIEVTEGVDMFNEKFAADDPIKEKAGKGLRANPKQVDVVNVSPNAKRNDGMKSGRPPVKGAAGKKRGRPPKEAVEGAAPKKRGRPPKAAIEGAAPKKRGRPPKAAVEGAAIEGAAPKKRGRPPKADGTPAKERKRSLKLDMFPEFPEGIRERVTAMNETNPERAGRIQQLITQLNKYKDIIMLFDSPRSVTVDVIDTNASEIEYFAISDDRLVLCAPR